MPTRLLWTAFFATVLCLDMDAAPLDLLLGPGPAGTPSIGCRDNIGNLPFCDYNPAININGFFNAQGGLIYSGTAMAMDPVGNLISATSISMPPPVAAPAAFIPPGAPGFAAFMYVGDISGAQSSAEIDTSHIVFYPPAPDTMETVHFTAMVYFPFANQGEVTVSVTNQSGVCGATTVMAAATNLGGPANNIVPLASPLRTVLNCGPWGGGLIGQIGTLRVTVFDAVVFFPASADLDAQATPEPGDFLLLAVGLVFLSLWARSSESFIRNRKSTK